jgi:GNAT superfamily N-acetyltransferase
MHLSITAATIHDVELLSQLSVVTFTEAFAADNRKEDMDQYLAEEMSTAKLLGELQDSNNLFLIAWHNDEPVGYAKMVMGTKNESEQLERPIELERIYVLKKHYGKKAGARLMQYCLQYGKDNGYKTIWLGVWEQNHRAVKFYTQWGFELFGSHGFRLGSDMQTDVLMKKSLTQ